MSAIYDLAGGIFAPFTTIFRTIVFEMADQFGYDISSMRALPYDWRLAPMKLQERDQFFSHIRQQIEVGRRAGRRRRDAARADPRFARPLFLGTCSKSST